MVADMSRFWLTVPLGFFKDSDDGILMKLSTLVVLNDYHTQRSCQLTVQLVQTCKRVETSRVSSELNVVEDLDWSAYSFGAPAV